MQKFLEQKIQQQKKQQQSEHKTEEKNTSKQWNSWLTDGEQHDDPLMTTQTWICV